MGGHTAPAGFFGSDAYNHPLIAAVLMHMEAEINGAGVNFDQADALLHYIITEALAMAGAQHAH